MLLAKIYTDHIGVPTYRIARVLQGGTHPYRLLAGHNQDRELLRSDDYAMVHMAVLGIAQPRRRPRAEFYRQDGTLHCRLDPGAVDLTSQYDAHLVDADGRVIHTSTDWVECYLAYLWEVGYEF